MPDDTQPCLAYPDKPTTEMVVTLELEEETISVVLPRRDDRFIGVVTGLDYNWDGRCWWRSINSLAGQATHRAAELGRNLLAAGFPVRFPDDTIRQMAVEGTYEPEQRYWILAASDDLAGWLAIRWPGRDKALYNAAMAIPGARYDGERHCVVAPADSVDAIAAFAEAKGFSIHPKAAKLLAAARHLRDTALVVDPGQLAAAMPAPVIPSIAELLASAAPGDVEMAPIARPAQPDMETRVVLSYWNDGRHEGLTAECSTKNEDLNALLKAQSLQFSISGWHRRMDAFAGSLQDRAAELGRHLLAAGFVVQFPDRETMTSAVEGTYEPECRRWIDVGGGEYDGWFRLWWRRGEDVYKRAKALAGSRYDPRSRSVVVPREQFEEVLDFAGMHGFRLSPAAADLVEVARQERHASVITTVQVPRRTEFGRPVLAADDVEDVNPDHLDTPYFDHPLTLKTDLLPHQVPAVAAVLPMRFGGLFMDMGTGKTRTAIELVHRRRQRISKVVWFCPVSLKETIRQQIIEHTANCAIYVFDDRTTEETLPADAFWYIVGIESISSSDRVTLAAHSLIDRHTFAVVDESSYIATHDTIRTRRIINLCEEATYRLILTGTPFAEGVVNLYAQMRFLSKEILGYNSFYAFAANHLVFHEQYPGLVVETHNTDWLAAKIKPYVYQVTKDECLTLPDKLYATRYCNLTEEQLAAYEQAKFEILAGVEEVDSYILFRLFTALQQIVSGFWNRRSPGMEPGDGDFIELANNRLPTLLAAIDEINPAEKVIVWCKFRYSVVTIAEALRERYSTDSVALHYGGVAERDRGAELARFRGPARFLVSTLATGGHGLNLTEACYALFYENAFSHGARIQAEDRIHRIGQRHAVTYIDIYSTAGIDARIARAHDRKENVIRAFRRALAEVKDMGRDELERFIKEL